MSTRRPIVIERIQPETVEQIQQLLRSMNDSHHYYRETAEHIGDVLIANTFRQIAREREQVAMLLRGLITIAGEEPVQRGTLMGRLHQRWASFRSELNSGDHSVSLIEAERADFKLFDDFRSTLAELQGCSIRLRLEEAFDMVKTGYDRILSMRDPNQYGLLA